MTTKGKSQSIIQLGSKRHFPLVARNMKRIAHKRGDNEHSPMYKKGSRRTARR